MKSPVIGHRRKSGTYMSFGLTVCYFCQSIRCKLVKDRMEQLPPGRLAWCLTSITWGLLDGPGEGFSEWSAASLARCSSFWDHRRLPAFVPPKSRIPSRIWSSRPSKSLAPELTIHILWLALKVAARLAEALTVAFKPRLQSFRRCQLSAFLARPGWCPNAFLPSHRSHRAQQLVLPNHASVVACLRHCFSECIHTFVEWRRSYREFLSSHRGPGTDRHS